MLMPIEKIEGEDEEDTQLLKEMAERAYGYITSFPWCLPVTAGYLAGGVGGIVALFLFEFGGKVGGTDDKLWVVTGDLPSAYMVVNPYDNARDALESYCLLMDDWVKAVRSGGSFEDVFPVSAARTEEHAAMLESRLEYLREEIMPDVPTDVLVDPAGEIFK